MDSALPTDKFGNVYHGPTTLAEAERWVHEHADELEGPVVFPDAPEAASVQEYARNLAETIEAAGYTGVAARLRKRFA